MFMCFKSVVYNGLKNVNSFYSAALFGGWSGSEEVSLSEVGNVQKLIKKSTAK